MKLQVLFYLALRIIVKIVHTKNLQPCFYMTINFGGHVLVLLLFNIVGHKYSFLTKTEVLAQLLIILT